MVRVFFNLIKVLSSISGIDEIAWISFRLIKALGSIQGLDEMTRVSFILTKFLGFELSLGHAPALNSYEEFAVHLGVIRLKRLIFAVLRRGYLIYAKKNKIKFDHFKIMKS
jgi:hypothetical protein